MKQPPNPNAKTGVLSIRSTQERIALVDRAAANRGMKRTEWLDRLVDRGLQGAGLLPRDQPARPGQARPEVEPIPKAARR